MIDGQTVLNIREVNSYQSEEIRSLKDRVRLLETQEFPFVRHRDFDAKGDLIVGSADNTYDNLAVGLTNGFVLQVDSTQTLGIKWGTIPTAGIADLSVTTAKLADGAVTTIKIADANVTTIKILDANVTNAKLANMAAATIKGRALGAGTGVPVDLTAAQLNAIVGSATLTLLNDLTLQSTTSSITLNNAAATTKGIIAQAASANALVTGSATGDIILRAAAQNVLISADTGTTANIAVTTTGRVGINTASPDGTLTLQATEPIQTFKNASAVTKLFWGVATGAGNIIAGSAVGDTVLRAVTQNILISADNGTTANVAVTTTGRVGINTASPDGTLTIKATQPLMTFKNSSSTTKTFFGMSSATNNIINGSVAGDTVLRAVTQDILISGDNGANANIRITSAGVVSTSGDLTVGDNLYVTDLLTVGTFGAWTNATYSTGWSTTAGCTDARYRKIGDVVEIEGTVAYAGGVGSNQIFLLPSGFRPAANKNYPADAATITGGRVAISTSGSVTMQEPSVGAGAQTYFTLDGIRFSTL